MQIELTTAAKDQLSFWQKTGNKAIFPIIKKYNCILQILLNSRVGCNFKAFQCFQLLTVQSFQRHLLRFRGFACVVKQRFFATQEQDMF